MGNEEHARRTLIIPIVTDNIKEEGRDDEDSQDVGISIRASIYCLSLIVFEKTVESHILKPLLVPVVKILPKYNWVRITAFSENEEMAIYFQVSMLGGV